MQEGLEEGATSGNRCSDMSNHILWNLCWMFKVPDKQKVSILSCGVRSRLLQPLKPLHLKKLPQQQSVGRNQSVIVTAYFHYL
jgi:hypothetical protein